jgi:Kef-type K+ transport system membrane component KefB
MALFSIFAIFVGAAALATVALMTRQAIIVAYIVVGFVLGPGGTGLITDPAWINDVAHIGIIFLLYLLGLNMVPQQLLRTLREVVVVVLGTCCFFATLTTAVSGLLGFSPIEAIVIGASSMFSSTIIGLKLLPTTTLHHKHSGDVIVGILLIQDLIAIVVLLILQGTARGENLVVDILIQLSSLPALILTVYVIERWIISPLLRRFDQIHEYIFLLVIAWCLGTAQMASAFGLSHEIGAFIAGVMLASSPIALFVADSLRPLRDFFLVLFFFSLGAAFDVHASRDLLVPAVVLSAMLLSVKPIAFRWLLVRTQERSRVAREIGTRLGQCSEFSFLISLAAMDAEIISESASRLIQLATLLTLIVSAYIVVLRYPTPIATRDSLRRD